MPTIYDVAKQAEVSIATVSRVANQKPGVRPQTRQKVQEAMKSLSWEPNPVAQALAMRA